jgi:hypothetical protein
MIPPECPREQDVLDAIATNRWPERLSSELSTHIMGCTICRDLASVATNFAEDHAAALEQVRLPSAGLVWWRAEIRTRQEAFRAAGRPITYVQVIAAVSGIGIALGLLASSGLGSLLGKGAAELWGALANQPFLLPALYLAIGVIVVLGPVALYLVLSDE